MKETSVSDIILEPRAILPLRAPTVSLPSAGLVLVSSVISRTIATLFPGLTLVLPEEEGSYKSLGGMIVESMGRVPNKGESVQLGGYCLIVRGADERHVTRVEIVKDRVAMLMPESKK